MTREWKNFNDITGDSPLAEQVSDTNDHRNARERREDENVDVFVVHMTGGFHRQGCGRARGGAVRVLPKLLYRQRCVRKLSARLRRTVISNDR